jgi:hypothetical protein
MNIIHWSRGKNMAICTDAACPAYRHPIYDPFLVAPQSQGKSKSTEKLLENQPSLVD